MSIERERKKMILAAGLEEMPLDDEIVHYLKDATIMMSLSELSFIDKMEDLCVDNGFPSDVSIFLKKGHNKNLNTCQPNQAPMLYSNIKSWAPEVLRNGMVQPIYVVKVGKKRGYHVVGGRHTCVFLAFMKGFDFKVPVIIINIDTETTAKMFSMALNNSRITTKVEDACTTIPHLVMTVDVSTDKGLEEFKGVVLGKNNGGVGNKNKEWQEKLLTALFVNSDYMGNKEIGVTPEYVMDRLGVELPKFEKPLRKDGAKGEGFTSKQMVEFMKSGTNLKHAGGTAGESWDVFMIQLRNGIDFYNTYCCHIDEIKSHVVMCLNDIDTPKSVRKDCETLLLKLDNTAYSDGVSKALGVMLRDGLHGSYNGKGANLVRYKIKDIKMMTRIYARALARIIADDVTDAPKQKCNFWRVVFWDKFCDMRQVGRKTIEALGVDKQSLRETYGETAWKKIDSSIKNKCLAWDKEVIRIKKILKVKKVKMIKKAKKVIKAEAA